MRREILFTLFGFLGGFVLAASIFWQPSQTHPPSEKAGPAVADNVAHAPNSGSTERVERGRRPVVVSVAGDESAAVPTPDSAPKTPVELMHETLAALSALKPEERQAVANDLIATLRAAGPAGLQAVRDFLRAG